MNKLHIQKEINSLNRRLDNELMTELPTAMTKRLEQKRGQGKGGWFAMTPVELGALLCKIIDRADEHMFIDMLNVLAFMRATECTPAEIKHQMENYLGRNWSCRLQSGSNPDKVKVCNDPDCKDQGCPAHYADKEPERVPVDGEIYDLRNMNGACFYQYIYSAATKQFLPVDGEGYLVTGGQSYNVGDDNIEWSKADEVDVSTHKPHPVEHLEDGVLCHIWCGDTKQDSCYVYSKADGNFLEINHHGQVTGHKLNYKVVSGVDLLTDPTDTVNNLVSGMSYLVWLGDTLLKEPYVWGGMNGHFLIDSDHKNVTPLDKLDFESVSKALNIEPTPLVNYCRGQYRAMLDDGATLITLEDLASYKIQTKGTINFLPDVHQFHKGTGVFFNPVTCAKIPVKDVDRVKTL